MKTQHLKTNSLLAALVAIAFSATAEAADEPGSDKRQYNLLNPTPRKLMREMSTDRPDVTESPITVDAGHYQIEMDFFNLTHDRDTDSGADTRTISYTLPSVNLKVGLLNNVDLQLVLEPYNHQRVDDRVAGTIAENSGFGDIQTRLKINLWGNDGGKTAMGLMPFVKWPTADSALGNGSVEGGLIVPFGMELPRGWGLGAMAEFDFNRDAVGVGYHTEFVQSVAVGRDIVGNLGGYLEFISVLSTESGADWSAVSAVGLTYGISEDLQLDAGANIGLTENADDIKPFVGISWRF